MRRPGCNGSRLPNRFGERAIAVTYCPLCGTGMAFDAYGRPVPGAMAFCFAWVALHLRTEVPRAP